MKLHYLWGLLAIMGVVGLSAWLLSPRPATPLPALDSNAKVPSPAPQQAETPPVLSKTPPAPEPAQTLSLLGRIQAAEQAALTTRIPARILSVRVSEGDTVQRGQLLIALDDSDFRTQANTASAGVEAARANLRKAEVGRQARKVELDSSVQEAQAGVRTAQAGLEKAQIGVEAARKEQAAQVELARTQRRKAEEGLTRARETLRDLEALAQVGGVPRNDLEGARTQVRTLEQDVEAARLQVQRAENSPTVTLALRDLETARAGVQRARQGVQTAIAARTQALAVADQDIAAARAALEQAQAGVAGARTAQGSARILSPLNGVATGVNARVGETAMPGMPLVTIVSTDELRAEALATARQLGELRVGQSAQVHVDTQPGKTFAATLAEIARVAEPDGRTFRVRFRFTRPVPVRPGQDARITVRTEQTE